MTLTITHAFQSAISDSTTATNTGEVTPSRWNAPHTIAGDLSGYNATSATAIATGATTSRTLGGYFSDIVNVKNFGAVGDGTTDNTAVFNAAVTAAGSGGTIFVPPGTYSLSSRCNLASDVNLIGVLGKSILLNRSTISSGQSGCLGLNTISNCYIDGITFDGGLNIGITTKINIVTVFQCSNIVFNNCAWQNSYGIACIFSGGGSQNKACGVRNSTFFNTGNYTGATTADRSVSLDFGNGTVNPDNFCINNYFNQCGLDCIQIATQTNFLCQGNQIILNAQLGGTASGAGIFVSGSCIDVIVSNNIISQVGGNGIDVNTNNGVVISGNICSTNGAAGIACVKTDNLIIKENYCLNNWQSATFLQKSGIMVDGGTANKNVIVQGNICSDTQGSPTQQYGIQYGVDPANPSAITNLIITPDNTGSGNVLGFLSAKVQQAAIYANGVQAISASGDPTNSVSAPVGSIFMRSDGGAVTTLYVKESGGSGNTGWVGK